LNYTRLSAAERSDYDRRILTKKGELVPYKWSEVVEKEVVEKDESGKRVKRTELEVVEHDDQFYIGSLTLRQTSGVVAILVAVFANGAQLKELTGAQDNMAFLNYLDEYHLSLFFSLIMGETQEWVVENWDMAQGVAVLSAFFRHNNFFGLLEEVAKIGRSMGISSEKAKQVILGQTT
jgi:hypothetical protein